MVPAPPSTSGAPSTPGAPLRYIRPGQPWLDTRGARIQAHGGSVLQHEGVYYWYGENKEFTDGRPNVWHWGIRAYRSENLVDWEDCGLIIPPTPEDPDGPMHPSRQVDRPHIIRNDRNGTWVCWVKIMGGGDTWSCFVADELLGPYELVADGVRPAGFLAGDFDLVVDPDDGRAYAFFEHPHSELICADLNQDYTGFTGTFSRHFDSLRVPEVREAPAYFRRGDAHYLVTSGTSGYFPNESRIAVADTYHGPWRDLGSPHIGPGAQLSFRSQISCVFPHPTEADTYITIADRWLPHLDEAQSDQRELFRAIFDESSTEEYVAELVAGAGSDLNDANTSIADYVWLPLKFDGDIPRIEWLDEWSPDPA